MPNLAIAIIFAISAFTMSFAGYGFALGVRAAIGRVYAGAPGGRPAIPILLRLAHLSSLALQEAFLLERYEAHGRGGGPGDRHWHLSSLPSSRGRAKKGAGGLHRHGGPPQPYTGRPTPRNPVWSKPLVGPPLWFSQRLFPRRIHHRRPPSSLVYPLSPK